MRAFILLAVLLPVVTYGQMPGGIKDITDSVRKEVVQFAVKQIQKNLVLQNGKPAKFVMVLQAREQITNTTNSYLTLKMSGDYTCDVNVTDNWQTNRTELSGGPYCEHLDKDMGIPGGISDAKPLSSVPCADREDVLSALDAAVCEVSHHHPGCNAFKIASTSGVNFTQQITSGVTYRFHNVPLVLTDCNQKLCHREILSTCDEHPNSTVKTCDLRVQFSPWSDSVYEVYLDDNASNPACLDL